MSGSRYRERFGKAGLFTCASIFLIAFSMVLLLSCTHGPDILGTWKESGKTSTLEFRQNGMFTAVDDMGMAVTGNYTLKSNGRILFKITYQDGSMETITGTLVVREKELVLTFDEDNEPMKYKKIQDR